jgi:methionine-gamma-lyase
MMPQTIRPDVSFSATDAVHAGREDLVALGVHALPLDLSTTYPVADLETAVASLDALVAGGEPLGNPVYARLHNPTVARFEAALARLEGASGAVAFASGMAALTAALLAMTQRPAAGGAGRCRHAVVVRPLYGTSDHLLACGLLDIATSFVAAEDVAAAIRPDTGLVILETPANPTCRLVDVAAVVAQAGTVPVLVDSTFATPVLQTPLALGATLVLHSATKFLGGHGDAVGGVVAASDDGWLAAMRQVRILTGGILHPLAGYLLHRGLQTLALRVRQAQASAQLLAARLSRHPAVRRVFYPGLADGDPLGLIGRQMSGPGALLAFEPVDERAAGDVMAAVRLFTPAVSLGSTDSLIQQPAGLTHRAVPAATRAATGISDGLLRVSVGLEEAEDLWADLAQAIELAVSRRRVAA